MRYLLLNLSEKNKIFNLKNGRPVSKRNKLPISIVDPFVYKYNHGYWFKKVGRGEREEDDTYY
jgi:hypothetical protein